jgi:hypothetical protein
MIDLIANHSTNIFRIDRLLICSLVHSTAYSLAISTTARSGLLLLSSRIHLQPLVIELLKLILEFIVIFIYPKQLFILRFTILRI